MQAALMNSKASKQAKELAIADMIVSTIRFLVMAIRNC
jgi:hypothetical protein